jgi:hypothetical protein
MRRWLMAVLGAGLVAACLLAVVVGAHGPDGGAGLGRESLTAATLPYPGATRPLPVPEVHIDEQPWREQLSAPPSASPSRPLSAQRLPRCDGLTRLTPCRVQ